MNSTDAGQSRPWRSKLGHEFLTLFKQVRNFAVFFFIVLGAPLISIYFTSGDRTLLFKLFIISYFSFLPAWIYLQFISVRGRTLWDEYVLNLYRLHIDHYAYLPKPPSYTFYYDLWRRIRAALGDTAEHSDNMYTKKFEALYGSITPQKGSNFIFRGENLFPVAIATIIISVGWVLVVEPTTIFDVSLISDSARANSELLENGGPQLPVETFRFAILGAYFYVLQMLVRRYFQNDLRTSAYLNGTMRFIVVLLLVWVMDILFREQIPDAQRLALAFIIGVFPSVGWEAIVALIKLPMKALVPSLRQRYPLSDLDGLNIWYESRLLEEGIEDMQNLATANLVDLMLNTRIPIARLIDWIDQAILYLHLSSTEGRNGNLNRDKLRQIGVRTATDLDDLFATKDDDFIHSLEQILNNEAYLGNQTNNSAGAPQSRPIYLKALHQTLVTESNIYHVREWKKYTERHVNKSDFSVLNEQVVELKDEIDKLRSEEGSVETSITFVNKTNQPVSIYWVDYNGNEVLYKTVEAGTSFDQPTYATHPWRIRYQVDEQLITEITATKDKRVLEITADLEFEAL